MITFYLRTMAQTLKGSTVLPTLCDPATLWKVAGCRGQGFARESAGSTGSLTAEQNQVSEQIAKRKF